MQGFRRHPFRVIGRLFWFVFEMLLALLVFLPRFIFSKKNSRRATRVLWLQRTCRRVGRVFRLEIQSAGTPPATGLLICNHLSYVDIIVLEALMPAVFVSKREVGSWPVVGLMAKLAGTLFIDRERRTQVGEVNNEIQDALADGALVIIFPEGTSSDGRTVLPFKSSLLEPAARLEHPLTVGSIGYTLAGGGLDEDVCYFGDSVLFPHLLNLLSKDRVRAEVRFAPVENRVADRKELAQSLRAKILELRN
jgi:lyso-ornithine lipid O-acyltransferase